MSDDSSGINEYVYDRLEPYRDELECIAEIENDLSADAQIALRLLTKYDRTDGDSE